MIPELRRAFNASWTSEKYADFLARLDHGCGTHVLFRCAETPVFFPRELLDKMAAYGVELVQQLMTPEYLRRSDATIPAQYNVPNQNPKPLFIQADFGIDLAGEPKLVEIQAFPSLYAFQPFVALMYREVYGLGANLHSLLGGLEGDEYIALLRDAILGSHKPEDVVLLEIEPEKQKTLCDFLLTERLFGVRPVCITKVEKRGRKLYYEGRPIERIYNRAIVDELERKHANLGFDFRNELDVEWAGHPNWYFRISKFSIPFLNHPSVPRTIFLDQAREIPPDLDNWVLKPLYSFAGLGVVIGPTRAEIDAIRHQPEYILQERVNFAATIDTPHGMTKAEVRIMYIWPPEAETPRAVTTIIRTGRGKMMGVDQNSNMEWVGASAGFWPE